MQKKGISAVITMVLIVLLVFVAVVLVWGVVREVIFSSSEKLSKSTVCSTNIDLDITDSCYSDLTDNISITIRNNNGFNYHTEFFMLKITEGGTSKDTEVPISSDLLGLETREFHADYIDPSQATHFVFIPTVNKSTGSEDGFYCYDAAIEFTPVAC